MPPEGRFVNSGVPSKAIASFLKALGSGGVSKALDVGRKGHGFHLVAPASLLYLGE